MNPETVFGVANLIALVGWGALVIGPGRRWSVLIAGVIVPTLLASAYVVILATHWSVDFDSFSTLASVAALFENPWALLAGWVHYLAFDLLVGGWISRDAIGRGVPHLLAVPCLVLTFLFGPAGWLAYQALARGHRDRTGSRATPA
jgi:hypothetical protein